MSEPFPDLRTDEETEDRVQNADLTEDDPLGYEETPFELAPKGVDHVRTSWKVC